MLAVSAAVAPSLGEFVLPLPASFSLASSGICTFKRGRLPPEGPPEGAPRPEFVLLGGPNVDDGGPEVTVVVEEAEIFLLGFGGLFMAPALLAVLASVTVAIELAELLRCGSHGLLASLVVVDDAQCCDNMERDSSIGVKIERDLTDMRFTGSSICACGACCCCGCG